MTSLFLTFFFMMDSFSRQRTERMEPCAWRERFNRKNTLHQWHAFSHHGDIEQGSSDRTGYVMNVLARSMSTT